MENIDSEGVVLAERIKAIRKAKGLNQTDFGNAFEVKQDQVSDYENGRNQPSQRILEQLIKAYSINPSWLESGTGEMFLPDKPEKESRKAVDHSEANKFQLYLSQLPEKDADLYVPYYNVEITAGRIEQIFEDTDEIPEGYIYAPHYPGCVACHVKGDSMYDRIFPGSRLFVYYMKNKKYIDYGQIYLIVLDGYRLLKYIHPHPTDETKVLLSSYNKHYSDWPVERNDILHLFLVKGYENQNAN